jgi:uncharacterized Fe-S cluster-containing radical SAM superfamily protein
MTNVNLVDYRNQLNDGRHYRRFQDLLWGKTVRKAEYVETLRACAHIWHALRVVHWSRRRPHQSFIALANTLSAAAQAIDGWLVGW